MQAVLLFERSRTNINNEREQKADGKKINPPTKIGHENYRGNLTPNTSSSINPIGLTQSEK